MATPDSEFTFDLTLDREYELVTHWDLPGVPELRFDEPPPLGHARGPNASRGVAAAVANCLSASLLFCLRKARVDVRRFRATVRGEIRRNERGRLRLAALEVKLHPGVPAAERERMARCLEIFEDFCVVTEAVRSGIPVAVAVETEDA